MPFLAKTANSRARTLAARWRGLRDSAWQFPFPVDFVVLWVEDNAQHRRARDVTSARLDRQQDRPMFGFDNQNARFRDNEELRACLRSVFWCMPWLRRVYVVVADYQFPERYVRSDALPVAYCGPELRVVPHSAIMPAGHLPTFNSQSIEAHLHRLDGLAERFIYANDDFMVGSHLSPGYFFSSTTGAPRYNLENTCVPNRRKNASMTKHSMAWCNNSRVLSLLFGHGRRRKYPCHVMVPMLRASFEEAWAHRLVAPLLQRTSCSPFRTSSNLYPIGLLVYWNFYRHGAQRRNHRGCLFHDVEQGDDIRGLMRHVLTVHPPLFCLNDGAYDAGESRLIRRSLCAMFPLPTPWEPHASVMQMMLIPAAQTSTTPDDDDDDDDDALD